jgi:2,4-dienoyl-CoA reductase (NADPH2)
LAQFEKFNFNSYQDLENKIKELNINIRLSKDLSPLASPVKTGGRTAPNAIAVLPMEGCDGNADGSPSELAYRRYNRYARGGAGLVWYEACAVVHEGRANPRQLYINQSNVSSFEALLKDNKKEAFEKFGSGYNPIRINQLAHSGRYSRPDDVMAPMIPQHDPILDPRVGINENTPVVTDEYLEELQEKYVLAAVLSAEAGFDGVDIKACHRYLISELLASHTREGRYGGSFENRTRFISEIVQKIKKELGEGFIIASRFNVFDAHPYPYGFGVSEDNFLNPDMTEPEAFVKLMIQSGVNLLCTTAGNPYYKFPYITRPLDMPVIGADMPVEHPLQSAERLFTLTEKVQQIAGDVPVIGSGYSWLRNYIPYAGSANLAAGAAKYIGIGRAALAYPDAPLDILENGEMDPQKTCIACSKCTQIMRWHGRTGCVVRDSKVYAPLFREARELFEAADKHQREENII